MVCPIGWSLLLSCTWIGEIQVECFTTLVQLNFVWKICVSSTYGTLNSSLETVRYSSPKGFYVWQWLELHSSLWIKLESPSLNNIDELKLYQRRRYRGAGGLGPPTFQIGGGSAPPIFLYWLYREIQYHLISRNRATLGYTALGYTATSLVCGSPMQCFFFRAFRGENFPP